MGMRMARYGRTVLVRQEISMALAEPHNFVVLIVHETSEAISAVSR